MARPPGDRALYTDPTDPTDSDRFGPLQHVPGSRPPRRPAGVRPPPPAPAPSDAGTQYLEVPIVEKSAVVAVLVAVDGDMKGEVFRLYEGENRLGRLESNDVVLGSKWISRQHAKVMYRNGIFTLIPLSDRNRTYLNETPVESCEMKDGDVIRLGHTSLRFRTIEGL